MRHKEIKEDCLLTGCVGVGADETSVDKCLLSGRMCSPMTCCIKDYFSSSHKDPHEGRLDLLNKLGLMEQYKREILGERID